jgi:hypothetical protein
LQKQLDSLKAGKGYTEKRSTSQQNAAIDKQIKDLQAQAEKNKQDAQINQWKQLQNTV